MNTVEKFLLDHKGIYYNTTTISKNIKLPRKTVKEFCENSSIIFKLENLNLVGSGKYTNNIYYTK